MGITKLIVFSAATALAATAAVAGPSEQEANAAFVAYPKESLENGEQGIVHYKVKIDSAGRAKKCEVTESSGYRRLDLATCQMLMDNARFTPNMNGGKTVRSTFEGRVHWRIG